MKKLLALSCVLLATWLWLTGCQSTLAVSPIPTPQKATTAAPTVSTIDTSLEQVSQLEAQKDYEAALAGDGRAWGVVINR